MQQPMTTSFASKKCWKWIRYILTDKNDNWDISILFWVYAVSLFLYKATVGPTPFDFTNFGLGCVGVFGAGKALDWLTERHSKDTL